MWVTGITRWDVGVLIGGNDFRHYALTADPVLQQHLAERVRRFWEDHVLAGVPPEVTARDNRTLGLLYASHGDDLLVAAEADEAEVRALAEARALEARGAQLRAGQEARLKARIADHMGLVGDWGKITWKRTRDSEKTDWKALAEEVFHTYAPTGAPWETHVQTHTSTVPGHRRFLLTLKGAVSE